MRSMLYCYREPSPTLFSVARSTRLARPALMAPCAHGSAGPWPLGPAPGCVQTCFAIFRYVTLARCCALFRCPPAGPPRPGSIYRPARTAAAGRRATQKSVALNCGSLRWQSSLGRRRRRGPSPAPGRPENDCARTVAQRRDLAHFLGLCRVKKPPQAHQCSIIILSDHAAL